MKILEKQWVHIKFSMKAKSVQRSVKAIKESDRKENIAEHMWSVSLIFWVLKEELKKEFPDLNTEKVYDLIQVHDLGEIITTDISTWTHLDKSKKRTKNELNAIKKICLNLPRAKGSELLNLYEEGELGLTIEAKVLKGIDRISPAIQRVVTNQGWISENHSETDLDNIQLPRIAFSKTLLSLYTVLKEEAKEKGLLI